MVGRVGMRGFWSLAVVFSVACASPEALPERLSDEEVAAAPDPGPPQPPAVVPPAEDLPTPAPDECEGLRPSGFGQPIEVTYPDPLDYQYCSDIMVDGAGNVAIAFEGRGPFGTRVLSADGIETAVFWGASRVQPRSRGFLGLGYGASWHEYSAIARSPSGEKTSEVGLPATERSRIFPAATGGHVILSTDDWGCRNGLSGHSQIVVQRVSDDGSIVSTVDIGGEGCPSAVAVSDGRDDTLVVVPTERGALGFAADRVIARWVSSDGIPQTPWFDLGAHRGGPVLVPLIGGGVAISGGSDWYGALTSGSTELGEIPAFAASLHDRKVTIVGGGRGYATYPTNSSGLDMEVTIDFFAPQGKHCGSVTLPKKVSELSIGRDGTVAALTDDHPNGTCTASWWPGLIP
jgi:hypothetical protein